MHTQRRIFITGLFTSVFLLTGSAMADSVTNGNFQTGTLSGFSAFTTSDGTTGSNLPDVVSFNTTGSGVSDAAHFNVGEVTYDGSQQGGGLSQTILIAKGGLYTISEDFASQDVGLFASNADAGTFSILLDGSTVASDSLGHFAASGALDRGSLSDTLYLASGPYTLQAEITRTYRSVEGITPNEYIDNVSVSPASAVMPEPSSLTMISTGVIALAGTMRRRLFRRY